MNQAEAYLVCATPRTGSTLLCEMLRQTGQLGVPREYFEYLKDTGLPRQPVQYFVCGKGPEPSPWLAQLNLPPLQRCPRRIKEYQQHGYRRYLPRILRRGSTPNGIVGAKIMWSHLSDVLELHTGDGSLASSPRIDATFRSLFPRLKYIYVTRKNKLRQAVSLWIALQTQRWRSDPPVGAGSSVREPIFHLEAIDFGAPSCLKSLNRENHELGLWMTQLEKRSHRNVVAVALANKIARIAWAVLARNEVYRSSAAAAA